MKYINIPSCKVICHWPRACSAYRKRALIAFNNGAPQPHKQVVTSTVPDTHKFPLDARIRIASHARIRIALHRIASHAGKCAHVRAFASHARKCAHSHRMRENARICAHSHRMRGNARIRIACAEMRALRRERRVNEIAGMTPARVFWRQTPETGFVVVRCIHKYWG